MTLKLTNFDTPNQNSDPSNIINVNGTTYFIATDATYGTELWKLDSNGNPVRVFDFSPGSSSSKPSNLTIFNGTLYFTASDSTYGSQLLKLDSNGSPISVTESYYNSYTHGSNPTNLTVVNNILYFTASDPTNGTELWAINSNGAPARISDIAPASVSSNPSNLINVNGTLYFTAADSTSSSSRKLWKIDSKGLPVLVSNDIYFSVASASPPNLTNVNGTLYFTATSGLGTELWKIDSNGTPVSISDIYAGPQSSNPSNLTNVNGTLYFTANDGISGVELWKLDNNGIPTRVSDILSGSSSSSPSNLTNVNGTLYFTATDPMYGLQLWTIDSNGIPFRLTNTYFSSSIPPISNLTNVNGTLFFTATDGFGSELWKLNSNGIPVRVSDISSGSGSSNPSNLTVIDGTLYFSANDGKSGRELWKLDNTGTPTLISDINKKGAQPPSNLTNVNGTLYFTAYDVSSGTELWKIDSNGTPIRVADLYQGSASSFVSNLTVVNGTLYFTATDGKSGMELWKIDSNGLPALVKDINSNGSSNPGNLVNVNGTLYFSAYDSTYGSELWKLDSNGNPVRVSDINPGSGASVSSSQNNYFTNVNGTLYFTAYNPTHGWEIWKLNSQGVPVRLSDIVPGNTISYGPSNLINVNGTLYFTAYDQTTGTELWKLDSNDTPVRVLDISPGTSGSNPSNLTNFNGSLYFTAYEPAFGSELWKIDSNGSAVRVSDINPGGNWSSPNYLTVVNDTLYFTAFGSSAGAELWKIDSNSTPLRVSNFTANSGYSTLFNLTNVNGTLYFNINDPTYGIELWKLDSNSTPVRITDIDSGFGSSNPSNLTYIDGKLYFVADNGSDGPEIWSLDTHSSSTTPSENKAPILSNTSVTLNPLNEDSGVPSGAVGTLVSSLVSFGNNVTDSDIGAVTGIAIASANTTYGSWYYSINNGTNWNPLGEMFGSVRLLAADANTRIYFRPNPNYYGIIKNALIFHAWDRTTGSNGGTASTTSVGGSTALSYATSTASISVDPVNDAPTIAPNQSFNIPKDATSGTVIGTVVAADVDGRSTLSQWRITGGNIDLNNNGVAAFSMNPNTGQIIINDINDLQPSRYPRVSLQVNVSDGFGTSPNQTVSVKLINPGDLDPTFGMGGKVSTHFSTIESANSVAIQSDGKIVVAGSNGDFAIARYNTNGSLDTSFGSGGKVVTDINGSTDHGNSIAIQSDGKIVVAGVAWSNIQTDFAVVRYNTDGSLDTSFGSSGKAITPLNSFGEWGNCVTIQSDGKIIVGGHISVNSSHSDVDFALVRYNPNGTLDTSFGNGGTVVNSMTTGQDSINSIVIQPDGKIVVGGFAAGNFALSRYNLNGTLDTSFGVGGKVITEFGSDQSSGYSIALQVDGKIVMAGYSNGFALARYNTNGTLDTSFGSSGKVTTTIGDSLDAGFSLAIQPNGKIVVAGFSENGSNRDFALAAYNPDGTLDTSFGNSGEVITPVGSGSQGGKGIALQSDNKIVVVGSGNGDFVIARYEGVSGSTTSSLSRTDPSITLSGTDPSYTENAPAIAIAPSATVSDPDSTNFDTGKLSVSLNVGGTADDRLTIHHQGIGEGLIGISGNSVLYNTSLIGSFTGGTGTTPLVITFGEKANGEAIQALIRNITYANVSDNPVTNPRSVSFVLTDGNGGTSKTVMKNVTVTSVNDAPIITPNQSFSVNENAATDTVVGTVVATDVDSTVFSNWTIASGNLDKDGDGTAAFTINPNSGQITVSDRDELDFESNPSFQLQVTVSDGASPSNAQTVRVNLNDVIENTLNGTAANDKLTGSIANDTINGYEGNDTINGDAGEDTINGGTGNDTINGQDGHDIINGGAGNDNLFGGLGDDTIDGGDGFDALSETADVNFTLSNTQLTGLGTDTLSNIERVTLTGGVGHNTIDASAFTLGSVYLYGGAGNDTISGGTGNDYLYGQDGYDILNGNAGNDYLYGAAGDDTLNGDAGNDYLYGQDGNDTINGGAGNDFLYGASGDDTIDGGDGIDGLSESADVNFTLTNTQLTGLGTDTISNIERITLTGGVGSNTIDASAFTLGSVYLYGGAGNDTISGSTGNDNLYGQDGNDIINGGAGNDNLFGGLGDDTIDGGDGIDTLSESADVNFTLTNTQLTGLGTDTLSSVERIILRGGVGNNIIDASAFSLGSVDVYGGAGNDTINGGTGNDYLYGQDGNDILNGNAGNDYLAGATGDDTLNGDVGNDSLYGQDGNDIIKGGAGNDTLFGGLGDDVIDGGDGIDTLSESADVNFILTNTQLTGLGTDTLSSIERIVLTGGVGHNIIDASAFSLSSVYLYGGAGNDTINGGTAIDYLYGQDGNDILNGNTGNDILYGGAGDDLINGDAGNDRLYGDLGADTFVLVSGKGTDTIYNFEDGIDKLGLSGGLTYGALTISYSSGSTFIQNTSTNEIIATLNGINSSAIAENDFTVLNS